MLISLKVANCFIFDDEVEFSMRPDARFRRFPSGVASPNDAGALKSAILLGPNNAGKSCFVRCLEGARRILLNQENPLRPNLFSGKKTTDVEIRFLDGNEYVLELKFDPDSREVKYERFSEIAFDARRGECERVLYSRDLEKREFESPDGRLKGAMETAGGNALLIPLLDASLFPDLELSRDALLRFANKLDVIDVSRAPIDRTLRLLEEGGDAAEWVSHFIRDADLSAEPPRVVSGKGPASLARPSSPFQERPFAGTEVPRALRPRSARNGELFDSAGTYKFEALAGYVVDALSRGRILAADDLDSGLHFRLTRNVISLFNNELNSDAQLVGAVHDVSLLDCRRLFRPNQIWFADRDRHRARVSAPCPAF